MKFVINVLPTCIFGLIIVLTFCSVKHFVGIHCYSYAVVCLYMYIELIYCDIIKYFRPTITLSDCIYYIYITFAKLRCILLFRCLILDIRLLPFDTFKKRVKTHLYLKYFGN